MPEKAPFVPRVLKTRKTKLGITIVDIPFDVVPWYDYEGVCQGMDGPAIRMEVHRDWTVTRGKAVYPNYNEHIHVAQEPLEYFPEIPLRLAWDVPGCPACCLAQINPWNQVQIFPPICAAAAESVSVYDFGERVAFHLLDRYAAPYGMTLAQLSDQLIHVGDPAGKIRPPRNRLKNSETRAAFDVLRAGSRQYLGDDPDGNEQFLEKPGWGWVIQPGAGDHVTRQGAVNALLTQLVSGGQPALIIDPNAGEIRRGLNGGYHFEDYGDGTFSREPVKNQAAHILNCVEYLATRLNARPIPPDRPTDEDNERPAFVSRAASGRY